MYSIVVGILIQLGKYIVRIRNVLCQQQT